MQVVAAIPWPSLSVEALYCAGPAGGAGGRLRITPRLAGTSCLIERSLVCSSVSVIGVGA